MRIGSIVLILVLCQVSAFSQSLSKSFNYYYAGQYEQANEAFHKILAKVTDNPAAAYGLANVFFMKDNRKYNLDSANHYIIKATKGLRKQWKTGDLKKFQAVGYREFTVTELQDRINKEAYLMADSVDEIEEW